MLTREQYLELCRMEARLEELRKAVKGLEKAPEKPVASIPKETSIETGYINGERVYLLGHSGRSILEKGRYYKQEKWETVKIIKHNDIVKTLNRVFICNRDGYQYPSHRTTQFLQKIIALFSDLSKDHEAWNLPYEVKKYEDINFQDRKKADGLAAQAKRLASHHIEGLNVGGLRVIKGSLHKQSESEIAYSDIVSDTFKAWKRSQGPEVPT